LGEARVRLYVVNLANGRDRYIHSAVDDRFDQVLTSFCPDVVHVGHLNHLSTSVIKRASDRGIPVIFTLHDYWLMCPRGQFLQTNIGKHQWKLCDGQDDRKCSISCYSRYHAGSAETEIADVEYWTVWVGERMQHVRQMANLVDAFIAPSEYLRAKFVDDFGLDQGKVVSLDYGFDRSRLSGRSRVREDEFVFGYIGTHTVAKGMDVLIGAFGALKGHAKLRIWGRENPQVTPSLRELAALLPGDARSRLEWCGEYTNQDIVRDVFNRVDAVVVPSIWEENSPLVIHEAQQARVPVITAHLGGMAEYVKHGVNGLLFAPRDKDDLTLQMQALVDDPGLAVRLGKRGYLKSASFDVPSIEEHVKAMEEIYGAARAQVVQG